MNDHGKPAMSAEFALMLPAFPGAGALLGLLWPAISGGSMSHCLPAVVVYGVCGGLAIGLLEQHAGLSARARDLLVATASVLWAVLVAGFMA